MGESSPLGPLQGSFSRPIRPSDRPYGARGMAPRDLRSGRRGRGALVAEDPEGEQQRHGERSRSECLGRASRESWPCRAGAVVVTRADMDGSWPDGTRTTAFRDVWDLPELRDQRDIQERAEEVGCAAAQGA